METPLLDRRQFFVRAGLAAAVFVAHSGLAAHEDEPSPGSGSPGGERGPRLLGLELLTSAPLAEMAAFYQGKLGLPVVEEGSGRLTLEAGASRLTFIPAGPEDVAPGPPFYHFAFNVPENKILAARAWQRDRSELLWIPERLRDPAYPDDVVHFRHWNAHSVFFLDPGGNVVEYIARHDLGNAAPGGFSPADILYASEIGLIFDDVPAAARQLREALGLAPYRGTGERFTALGDERGLVLVMQRGRVQNFRPEDPSKASRIYRTRVRVAGSRPGEHEVPGFPYDLRVEA